MESSPLLVGVIVPALIGFVVVLFPRAAWHWHRRDLPVVDGWGTGAGIATAFIISFAFIASGAEFGSASWHTVVSAMAIIGLASIIVWSDTRLIGQPLLAALMAVVCLFVVRGHTADSIATRCAIACVGGIATLAISMRSRTASGSISTALSCALSAFTLMLVASASSPSPLAAMIGSVGVLLVLIAIASAINRRFILGTTGSAAFMVASIGIATVGSSAMEIPMWWWWSAALAPVAVILPSLFATAPERERRNNMIGFMLAALVLAPTAWQAIASIQSR
ncbi:MAG: hypothetical protein O2800_01425 [Planctomycetota bacterium]|nr:hypothetical protein [Planctomycetota bacterium]